ncbi:hypothetical protein ACIBG8_04505 [Nonomuraea sp. NPDC050556]|uniref:hypothetical protein n=1 Tax=Nonomuraea sp. NPDC050556 TaxID=3364369 RepID=UPI003787FD36
MERFGSAPKDLGEADESAQRAPRGRPARRTRRQHPIRFRYDLPVDLLNRAPAGQSFTFGLQAGSHSATRNRPTVWWARVELGSTNGVVTLRTTTNDSAGGSVTQLVKRAYALR